MPRLTDKGQIRTILNRDRAWAAYALADLEPAYFDHCAWFGAPDGTAVALVYSAFSIPVVLLFGAPADLQSVLAELHTSIARKRRIYFVIRPEVLSILESHYKIRELRAMLRMLVEPECFVPFEGDNICRLGSADRQAVLSLFADGDATGQSPEFFQPEMLENGIYYGVSDGDCLAAIGGTHVLAPEEGVCVLGNIYTRRGQRGRGLGACVTSAVVSEALDRKIRTIVLNVNQANVAAIRLYRRLGFRPYCKYYEAIATPKKSPGVAHGS